MPTFLITFIIVFWCTIEYQIALHNRCVNQKQSKKREMMSKKEGLRKASETAAQAEEGVCKRTGILPALLEGLFDKETLRNIADTESPETLKQKETRQL